MTDHRRAARDRYKKYINSRNWWAKRDQFLAAGFPAHCIVCRARRFHLHHMTYERFGCERLTDLVPLCEEHHDRLHNATLCAGSGGYQAFEGQLVSVFGLLPELAERTMLLWHAYDKQYKPGYRNRMPLERVPKNKKKKGKHARKSAKKHARELKLDRLRQLRQQMVAKRTANGYDASGNRIPSENAQTSG